MTSFNETSLTLLEQVRANHAEAWDRLVDLYAPLVRYWGRRSQLGDEDVAEVFQETFRAVATHIQSFRRDRKDDSFRGWLRTITTNKIRDHFRRLDGQAIAEGGSVGQMKLAAICMASMSGRLGSERSRFSTTRWRKVLMVPPRA